MPGINDVKRGGERTAHGIGRVAHGVGNLAGSAGGGIGKKIGKAGNIAGRLAGRGGERAGHLAGRGGHYAGRAVGKVVNKIADTAIDKGGQALAAYSAGTSIIAAQIIKKHKKETLILLLIILCAVLMPLFFILYILIGGNQDLQDSKTPLVITKTGPSESKKGDKLNYSIEVTYPGTAQSAVITDPLPDGTQYVSSTPKAAVFGNVVTWGTATLKPLLSNPIQMTVTLVLQATKDNTNIGNVASVTLTGASLSNSSTTTVGNTPATNDNCHGVYSSWMAQVQTVLPRLHISGANYGDPTCELVKKDPNGNWIIDKDKELAYLKDPNGGKLSAQEAEAVFICIIPNESGYNADAVNLKSTSAGSSGTPGAFGLFQMNAKGFANTGQPEDVGDVVWSMQITNAIAWKNKYNHGVWSNYWPQSYSGCLSHYGQ